MDSFEMTPHGCGMPKIGCRQEGVKFGRTNFAFHRPAGRVIFERAIPMLAAIGLILVNLK